MKLKTIELDGKTYAEVNEGKPVYLHDDGKEIAFDAPSTVATITRLNGEAKGHRERAEKAEGTLKNFEGITDVEKARKALDIVKNLDDKKLIDAGEVEKIKLEAIKAIEDKYSPVVAERDSLKKDLVNEKIGGAFSRSKFIAEKLAIPFDMVEAKFGGNFKLEENAVVAYDQSGNKIFSRVKPGDLADFDEAMDILISSYPNKDHILKGSGANGGGAGGSGGAQGQGKTMPRAQFDTLSPAEQSTFVKGGGKPID